MSSVVPPPAPLPVSGQAGTGPVALTQTTSGQMPALPPGTMLEAVAQARAAKGVLTVMTPAGSVQLKALPGQTLPPIPEGARLLLQVTDQGVTLLAVNGRPLAGLAAGQGLGQAGARLGQAPFVGGPAIGQAGQPPSQGVAAQTPGPQPQPAQATAQPNAAPGLTATMIRPAVMPGAASATPSAPAAGQSAGLPPDLPAGTRLTVRIAGIEPPATGAATAAAQTATPVPSRQAAPQPAQAGPQPAATAEAAAPPQSWTATPGQGQQPAAPRLLAGTVVAHPPGGQAVVQTPVGTLALPTQADLPVGTRLHLEIAGPPAPPTASAPTAAPTASTGLQPGGWPTLTETMSTLSAAGDRQTMELLMRSLPQVGPRLAAGIVAFAGSMRNGEVRAGLIDGATKGLEKAGRKDLAERLKGELEDLAKEGGRPVAGGEWTGFSLPLLFGQVVDPVRLFVRRPQGGDESDPAKAGNGERFLLDFNLTRLGRMQMDGLVRRDDKLFDLIIRTDQALPPEMRRDILGIFTDASELVGTKGSVSFQSGGRWVDLAPDAPPPTKIVV